MQPGNLSRRGFAQRSMAAMTLAGLPIWFAKETLAAQAEDEAHEKKTRRDQDTFVGALIGCGGRGRGVMDDAIKHGVRCVAVCDVDSGRAKGYAETVGGDCQAYTDFRELLARDDLEVVVIGTPDHWHTIPALAAARRNLDIYCEKPLTLTIAEGQALVQTVRDHEVVFQVGSQQRSDSRFHLACELVRNGRLGKIQTVETRINRNPKGGPFPTSTVPDGLDWDFWQGPVPDVDFVNQRCHYNFRWWYEYSGGKMTDWGAHHNDIAQWGLGMDRSGPVELVSEGAQPINEPNSYNVHPEFTITYTYQSGTKLVCSSEGENGVKFIGEDSRWIFVNRQKIEASDPALLEEKLPDDAERLYDSHDHMRNFLDCVRSRNQPICDVETGHRSISVCHLGVISLRMGGRKLRWDPEQERFVGDALANEFLSRPMRKPWSLDIEI